LSPLQFSISVSIVVVLLGGAGLAGYFYGVKKAQGPLTEAEDHHAAEPGEEALPAERPPEPEAAVTFYSALTEPRKGEPAPASREPLEKKPASDEKKAAATPPASGGGHETTGKGPSMLQVASYKDQTSARTLLADLSAAGYAGTVIRADLGERGIWFRVRIGPYASGEETERILARLREEKDLKGYVVKK